MNKAEFLKILGNRLGEELPRAVVISNLQYYESYINGAIAGGKTEAQVMEELGDPNAIARTIVDSQTGENIYAEQYAEDADFTETVSPDQSTYQTQSGTGNSTANQSGSGSFAGNQSQPGDDMKDFDDFMKQTQAGYSTNTEGQQPIYTETHSDTEQENTTWKSYNMGNHGCLIMAIVLILAVIVVFAVVGKLISFFMPVLVPILLIVLVVSLLSDKRRN